MASFFSFWGDGGMFDVLGNKMATNNCCDIVLEVHNSRCTRFMATSRNVSESVAVENAVEVGRMSFPKVSS